MKKVLLQVLLTVTLLVVGFVSLNVQEDTTMPIAATMIEYIILVA